MAGFVKIGKTRRPDKRLATFNTTDPFRRFRFAWTVILRDYDLAERIAHARLAGLRIGSSEWFLIHPDDAFSIIQESIMPMTDTDHAQWAELLQYRYGISSPITPANGGDDDDDDADGDDVVAPWIADGHTTH
jgi:hypothetical protein